MDVMANTLPEMAEMIVEASKQTDVSNGVIRLQSYVLILPILGTWITLEVLECVGVLKLFASYVGHSYQSGPNDQ